MSIRGSGIVPYQVGGRWVSNWVRGSTGTYIDQAGVMQVAQPNVPRVDWSSGSPVLLDEGAGTNLFLNSSAFDGSGWGDVSLSVTANSGSAPDQSDTASLLTVLAASSFARATQNAVASSGAATCSFFVKYTNTQWVTLTTEGNDGGCRAWFDILNGVEGVTEVYLGGTGFSSALDSLGFGWFRVSVSLTASQIQSFSGYVCICDADNSITSAVGQSVLAWGGQLEAGPLSSYIPTSGAPASRAADVSYFVAAPPVLVGRGIAARTGAQVLGEMLAISPQGDAMPTSADTVFAQMLTPMAAEFAAVEQLMLGFASEINPLTALALLADFERVLGPDPFGRDTGSLSIGERQQLAFTRWVGKFGVRTADFVALAAGFGVAIEIEQYSVTAAGAFAGTLLVNHPTQFSWRVILPTPVVSFAKAGSAAAGDLVSEFPPLLVQGAIEGRAPAQTSPFFSYTG